ncbi:winged helix-turn-helix domain-containing protein [Cellulomonas sp.]|uniref:ArsR/SmtB family transcription factor n=1 Tax=Cellulomonas sp. TaxID=40001 RepID=UPI002D2A75A8|nr:winged helix-turn-helix domain-containing protein [Cellulomonas sp.]HYQ74452.1 winged helix-turn-helix domain-containing protein [Cellulomonas sp.]
MAPAPDAEPDSATDPADLDADARALASTVRLRILRLCLDEPLTNREIADRLAKNPATVLHHVRTLVDRGFLAADPVRRGARGSREVPYRATRKSWRAPDFPGKWQLMLSTFLEEVAEADPESVRMTRLGVRLGAAEHDELMSRVDAFFGELAARRPSADGRPYSILFALHEDAGRLPRG